jgi:hypothetical protein
MSGFIWQFLSKLSSRFGAQGTQRVIKDDTFARASKEAWARAQANYSKALESNDIGFVQKTLRDADIGSPSSFNSAASSRVVMSKLQSKLSELEKVKSKPNIKL